MKDDHLQGILFSGSLYVNLVPITRRERYLKTLRNSSRHIRDNKFTRGELITLQFPGAVTRGRQAEPNTPKFEVEELYERLKNHQR